MDSAEGNAANFSEPRKNSTEFSNELTFTNMFLVFTLTAQKIANATAHQMLVLNFFTN
jgi:hypothetical protein